MTAADAKLDPQMLQARWMLGCLTPDELVNQACSAIEQGFDGPALWQLAVVVRPGVSDLGDLPVRAFADMGLTPCDIDQARALLQERAGELTDCPTIRTIIEAFPSFSKRWLEHLASSGGESPGPCTDMAEFAYFVAENLYEKGQIDEVRRVFQLLEKLYVAGDEDTRTLIVVDFFEILQGFAAGRPYGDRVFEKFLGRKSKKAWKEIKRSWKGEPTWMFVIRVVVALAAWGFGLYAFIRFLIHYFASRH